MILRLYCDWDGRHEAKPNDFEYPAQSDGCPEWMYDEAGDTHITDLNGNHLTDHTQ